MARQIIFTPNAAAPPPTCSQAVNAAGLVFVSGTAPVDPATKAIVGTTIQQQTRQQTFNAALLRSTVAGLCVLLGIGCSDASGARTTAVVVTVSPTLVIGERRQADTSVATTQVGVGPSSRVTWESSDRRLFA